MAVTLARQLFTVNDYYKMAETGILAADDKVELLDGEVVQMSPAGSYHASVVDFLNRFFNRQTQVDAIVRVQSPIRLDDYSEPEPDLALLRLKDDFYQSLHPKASDVFLLVEVADSSLEKDMFVKIPLYAKTGIPEVWIVDLTARVVHVFRNPSEGEFQSRTIFSENDRLAPSAFPDAALSIDSLF